MKRLLLVDDDVESLAVVRARLANDGIEISYATGGRAGLEAAKSQHPDLILLDLDMPGFDVCRIMKADFRDVARSCLGLLVIGIAAQPVIMGRVGLFQVNVFDQFAAFGTQGRGRRKFAAA